jgi:hypothetical protein
MWVMGFLAYALFASPVIAHGGGLNVCGCHFNRKTGECHCHQDRGCGCECQPDHCSTPKQPAEKTRKKSKGK